MKKLNLSALILAPFFAVGVYSAKDSVNFIARDQGWGWHRTNNALKELGVK